MLRTQTKTLAALATLFLLLAVGCRAARGGQAEESFPAAVRVSGRVVNTVSPLLFGDNIEWTNHGMGLWLPEERRFDPRLVEELRQVGITHLRYPGGTLSDYFHWRDAVGTQRRPITNPFANMRPEYPTFGPEEFIALCRELDIPGTITLNAGTGTPEEAAAWVHDLRERGFPVTAFAVGNEIYMEEPGKPIAKTAEEYIQFYRRCKAAVEEVAPGTKLGAIGLTDVGAFPLSRDPDWMRTILQALGNQIAFIDLHNGYAPVTRFVGVDPRSARPSDDEAARCFLGASVYAQRSLEANKAALAQYAPDRGRTVEIHITEHGPLIYPLDQEHAVADVAWNRSLAGALYQACLFNVFLKEPKLTSANHLPLCQDVFGALVGIRMPGRRLWRNAVYYVFQMYARMKGREVLEVEVEAPTYSTPAMGIVPALQDVPLIDGGAYRVPGEQRASLFLVNRDIARSASVEITADFALFTVESVTTLTADSYLAENTPDAPDRVQPVTTPSPAVRLTPVFTLTLPKHSLTIIELTHARAP